MAVLSMRKRVLLLSLLLTAWLACDASYASAQGAGQQVRADDLTSLRAIDVPAAWHVSKGSGVTVAVLDTGADPSAPDLSGTVTTGPDYAAGANPPGYLPPHLHGTYICSIIAGHGSGPGRGEGMIGVAPQAKILSIRVILDDQEPGFLVYNENAAYDNSIASGIEYAVRHGADVINTSLGGTDATRSVRLALGYAIAHGVVVVAAAGNSGTGRPGFSPYVYPASFTGVISAAAVDARGQRAHFSERNSSVVVSAPGVSIVGDGPGGSYVIGSGTSPASAFVAGVAALIKSKYPRLTPGLVTQAIVNSARHRPAGGYSPGTGFGEIDAAAALVAAGRLWASRFLGTRGMAASAHFGRGAAGPIAVVHRDHVFIAALAIVAIVAAIGFLAAVAMLAVLVRRRRRGPPPPPMPPPTPISPPVPLPRAENPDDFC